METKLPRIFNPNRRKREYETRYSMNSDEYLDIYKVNIYLQDAVKIILDRRDERPMEILQEYFNIALRGEHILLREYTFINSNLYNRSCFLYQIGKIFHANPYYEVITALDYYQCLCLICSDFPRSVVGEAARILPIHPSFVKNPTLNEGFSSVLVDEPFIFNKYDLNDLRRSLELFFYYAEFMDKVKSLFTELLNGNFDIESEVSISLFYTGLQSFLNRDQNSIYKAPTNDLILETLLSKAQKKLQLPNDTLYTVDEISGQMHGTGTISFREMSMVYYI